MNATTYRNDPERLLAARQALEVRLQSAPSLGLRNAQLWEQTEVAALANADIFGTEVIRVAHAWGRLMQIEVDRARSALSSRKESRDRTARRVLRECAEDLWAEAEVTCSLLGYTRGAARALLIATWTYGDALKWVCDHEVLRLKEYTQ